MSDSAQTPAGKSPPTINKAPPQPAGTKSDAKSSSKSGAKQAIIAAVGSLCVVAAIGLVLMKADLGIKPSDTATTAVTFVAQRDIGAAATTLTPSAATALVDDAQRCKIPLVSMTIAKGTAPIGSTIRIRSGNYVSPYFTITETMQRIAMPYPAPYGSGSGAFVVEGTATGAVLGLTPTRVMIDLPGAQTIPVVWRPVNPC